MPKTINPLPDNAGSAGSGGALRAQTAPAKEDLMSKTIIRFRTTPAPPAQAALSVRKPRRKGKTS
jgi:hypothetical protein